MYEPGAVEQAREARKRPPRVRCAAACHLHDEGSAVELAAQPLALEARRCRSTQHKGVFGCRGAGPGASMKRAGGWKRPHGTNICTMGWDYAL